ncbi:MAG: hypothetical protein COB49_08195 [Alphaproteobacteria bacterium]|nr:MAG: hypothetical protein COB49_08195 [Alphaproteobacteria bacterium]
MKIFEVEQENYVQKLASQRVNVIIGKAWSDKDNKKSFYERMIVLGKKASRRKLMLGSASLIVLAANGAIAQETTAQQSKDNAEEMAFEEIVVKGVMRRSMENSLATKREQTVISDAIMGADMGDLPDLSVAETLERITGVTSDRFKGGASELSIRGLGAFLGASFYNGREISSGSDGRDVNFGQFPSELIGGVIVYKSQQASLVEGGISGNIELLSLKPIDYGKKRIQMQVLAGYSDYENRVRDGSDVNTRFTASYVDQFDTNIGTVGISVGVQLRRDTAPEDIYTTSSTWRPCNTDYAVDGGSNCSFQVDDDGAPTGSSDTYFTSNQYIYRAMKTEADRDAILGSIQWQPDDHWDINVDFQYSDRKDVENRANLVIADGRRRISPIDVSPTGALLAWSGESRLENQSVYRTRDETYKGFGFNAEWTDDRWTLSSDVAFSKTERRQDEFDMRIRTNKRVWYEIDTRGQTVPALTLTDVSAVEADRGFTFDLNNHDLFTNGARARRRLENVDDDIFSVRFDGQYEVGGSFIDSIQAGVRFADRHRLHDDGIDTTVSLVDGNYTSEAAIAARQEEFLVRDLFAGADTPMKGITWATWNPRALFEAIAGSPDAGLPGAGESTLSPHDADITEKTYALYLQSNFRTEIGGLPVTGNFGVRAVYTKIASVGVSSAFATSPGVDPGTILVVPVGDPVVNTEQNSFWNILPSANMNIELSPETFLRLAVYSAIARPDQEAMSAALGFDDNADLDDLGTIVSASGNPFLEPIKSLNFDVSYEWYPSDDTALSFAFYAKKLQTGFEPVQEALSLIVDGEPVTVAIGRVGNSDNSSRLLGFEATIQHIFSNLPAPFDGLGIKAGYNYADSDFEFADITIPDGVNALADFTEPANIPGYSKHSGNVTAFWENNWASLRIAYKIRSSYFKPFRTSANRFTRAQGFLDFSASFDLTEVLQLRVQGLNLLDEPNIFYRPTRDSLAQADYSGRRFFVGLRARF